MDPMQNNNNSKRLLEYFKELLCSLLHKKAVQTHKVAVAAVTVATKNIIDIVETERFGVILAITIENPRNTTIGGNPIAFFF